MEQSNDELVDLDLSVETLAGIALYAHERDITINQAIVEILEKAIREKEHGAVDQRQSQLTQNQPSVGSNPTRATEA